jgi:metal-responsive CopG/Arc/MetJ family transcriptional regulator
MNYSQIVDICCRDLRRYLEATLKTARGGVVTVKMRRLLRAELPPPDRARYSTCLSRVLGQWRWGKAYVIPRQDAEKLLESFDSLCESAKNVKRRKEPKPRRPRKETVLVAVALPNGLLRAVDEYASQRGVPRSAVIIQAIQDLIDMKHMLEELDKARDGQLERITLRLPVSLLDALNRRAAMLKAPRSAVIRYAVYKLIEKIKTEPAP